VLIFRQNVVSTQQTADICYQKWI